MTPEHLRKLPALERLRMVAGVPSDMAVPLLDGLEPADLVRVVDGLRPQRAFAVSQALPLELAAKVLPKLSWTGPVGHRRHSAIEDTGPGRPPQLHRMVRSTDCRWACDQL